MKLTTTYIQTTVRGEFEGHAFEADYSSDDGWNAGNGIVALEPGWVDSDQYEDWFDRLTNCLWDQGAPQ